MELNEGLADLDSRIRKLKAKRDALSVTISKLEGFRTTIANDPVLGAELRLTYSQTKEDSEENGGNYSTDQSVATNQPVRRHSSDKVFEIVKTYFVKTNNSWKSSREIAEATGLTKNTVNALLFASHEQRHFDSDLKSPRRKYWRLKKFDSSVSAN